MFQFFILLPYVIIGDHDFSIPESTEQKFRVKNDLRHSQYEMPTLFNNDVTLLQLDRPAKFNRYVQPICLPKQNVHVPVGTVCYVTGMYSGKDDWIRT